MLADTEFITYLKQNRWGRKVYIRLRLYVYDTYRFQLILSQKYSQVESFSTPLLSKRKQQ